MKRLQILLVFVVIAMSCGHWHCGRAHADAGGRIAMPGPCDFPFIGHQVYATGGFFYYCDGPVEENGSHWHAEGKGFNAGGPGGDGIYGFEFSGFGVTLPGGIIGGGDGYQGYVWPDLTVAPWPNPPGAWKNRLIPRLPPPEHRGPPAPPPDADVHAPPADAPLVPQDTNPTPPNSDALSPTGG